MGSREETTAADRGRSGGGGTEARRRLAELLGTVVYGRLGLYRVAERLADVAVTVVRATRPGSGGRPGQHP